MHSTRSTAGAALLALLMNAAPAHAGLVSTLDTTASVPPATSSFDGLKDLALRGELGTLVSVPATGSAPNEALAGASQSEIGTASYDVALAIWHCIRAIRAQRESQSLQLIESRMEIINATLPAVSAVPLPAATWFMLMGLLGLAGARVTRRHQGAVQDRASGANPQEALPAGV